LSDFDSVISYGQELPANFSRWHHLSKAQYLEADSLLSGYLLSSQGDRVSAANSIEGRYPFLDHRVAEFAAKVPPWHKLLGLKEKYVLKRAMRTELPPEITGRVKQPYMAPDSNSFTQPDSPEYVGEMLSESKLREYGLFNPEFVANLRQKCQRLSHAHLSFKDNMSFIGILSTQLFIDQFVKGFQRPHPIAKDNLRIFRVNNTR